MAPKVNIMTIAQKASVSAATVSLALNEDPRVASETRRRIKSIAQELNYIPNSFAKAFRQQKSNLLGVLTHHIGTSYFSNIIKGIGKVATMSNYGVLMALSDGSWESDAKQLEIFQQKNVDGVIVLNCSNEIRTKLYEISLRGTDVVFASTTDAVLPFVKNDDIKTGYIATEHLIHLGHNSLAFAYLEKTGSERFQGCLECCVKNGISNFKRIENENEMQTILSKKDRPTGIIAYCDADAIKIIQVANMLNLRIPEDLSIVGVDDSPAASLPKYSLTTVAPKKEEIGKIAVQMIFDFINGKKAESVTIEPILIIRNSTRQFCESNETEQLIREIL